MMSEISYSNLRRQLFSVLDRVCDDQEVVIVRRGSNSRGDVAILPADELTRLTETASLRYGRLKSSRSMRTKRTS